jgi:hypothetical protein
MHRCMFLPGDMTPVCRPQSPPVTTVVGTWMCTPHWKHDFPVMSPTDATQGRKVHTCNQRKQ